MRMYKWPNDMSTWWFGDGRMLNLNGGYYMHTDVGYMRLIYYFGLPCTLFFVWLLFKYAKILRKGISSKPLRYFFITLPIWFVILNLKGLTFESEYFVLFLVFSALIVKRKPVINSQTI